MNDDIQRLCANLALGTLNGAYQGLLITVVVTGLLRLLVRTNAATRHAIWLASLILVVLLIPAHCWLDSPGQNANHAGLSETGENRPGQLGQAAAFLIAGTTRPNPQPPPTDRILSEADLLIPGLSAPDDFPSLPQSEALDQTPSLELPAPSSRSVSPQVLAGGGDEQTIPETSSPLWSGDGFGTSVARFLRPASLRLESELGLPLLISVVFLWFGGAAVRVAFLGLQVRRLHRLGQDSSIPEPGLERLFEELKLAGDVPRKVRLRLSTRQRCPMVLGFFRPVILLPEEIKGELAQVRQVLCHELAHVRRYDDWVNLLQHFAQALLFFHPAVWWIGKRLSLEREIACDDQVLQQGAGRKDYALVLTNVASLISKQTPLLAPGVSNNHSQLQQRISMILNTRRNASPCLAKGRLTTVIAATAFLAVLALYSAPRMVFAGSPSAAAAQPSGSDIPISVAVSPVVTPTVSVSLASADTVKVAASDSEGEPSPAVEPGPKFKPENPGAEQPEPAEVVPPDAPLAPNADFAPRPPRKVRAGKPGKTPRPPESPDGIGQQDGSIDERLQRLEKMVRALMDQQGVKRSRGMAYFKDDSEMSADLYQQKLEKMRDYAEAGNDKVAEQKFKELAERQAARAVEQAKRAADQAKRASKDLEARIEQDQQGPGEFHEGVQRQLEALRKARESLGQEMEKLSHQIQKLEREQQRGEKEQQRRGEAPREKLQAQTQPDPEVVR
jgi:beta-lactamase regulating signal transducer with metallopeptidase domain